MKFIKVCEVTFGGGFTCIYSFLNVDCIVRISISIDRTHKCLLPTVFISSGERFLICYRSDLVSLIGEDVVKEYENELHES